MIAKQPPERRGISYSQLLSDVSVWESFKSLKWALFLLVFLTVLEKEGVGEFDHFL